MKNVAKNAQIYSVGLEKVQNVVMKDSCTISLGNLGDCSEVPKIVEHRNNGTTVLYNSEYPNGVKYDNSSQLVLKVLDGLFDLDITSPAKMQWLIKNEVCRLKSVCTESEMLFLFGYLRSLNVDLSTCKTCSTYPNSSAAIQLDAQLMDDIGCDGMDVKGAYLLVCNVWDDPDSEPTKIYNGDWFMLTSDNCGFRMSKEEFNTYCKVLL